MPRTIIVYGATQLVYQCYCCWYTDGYISKSSLQRPHQSKYLRYRDLNPKQGLGIQNKTMYTGCQIMFCNIFARIVLLN
jgi:hypothetical protein